jgi:hypothetical protein
MPVPHSTWYSNAHKQRSAVADVDGDSEQHLTLRYVSSFKDIFKIKFFKRSSRIMDPESVALRGKIGRNIYYDRN